MLVKEVRKMPMVIMLISPIDEMDKLFQSIISDTFP